MRWWITTALELLGYVIIVSELGWLVALGIAAIHFDILIVSHGKFYDLGLLEQRNENNHN